MTFEYIETDDLIVMLGDFMLPSVKANGGINYLYLEAMVGHSRL